MTKPKRPPVNATVPIDNNSPSASALVWHSKHIALGRMQNSALGILAAGVSIRQIEAGTQNIPKQSTMDRCQMVQQWRSSSWTTNRIEGIWMQLFGRLKWSCNFWLCLFGLVFWFFLSNGNHYLRLVGCCYYFLLYPATTTIILLAIIVLYWYRVVLVAIACSRERRTNLPAI